jgi:putative hydrolase of the HAD superfamily
VKYKAVFFDAGNTLLTPYPSVEDVCAEVFARSGYAVPFDELKTAIGAGDRYYEERYWQDDTFWKSEREAAALWVDLYTVVAHQLGINGDTDRLAREIYDEFGHPHRWQFFADVEETLQALKDHGLKVGVISNWDSRLTDLLSGIGADKYLDFIMCSAVVGMIKPQPGIFTMALKRVDVLPHEALHVGDHYFADVLGARGAGITPVLIDRANNPIKTDCITIGDLRHLLNFLD